MTLPLSMRRSVAILAVLALSLLLLRPACDVLALQLPDSQAGSLSSLHHDSGTAAKADHAFQVGSHEASLSTVAKAASSVPLAAAPMSAALVLPALVFLSRLTAPGAAPPPSRSYYIRSARILR